MQVNGAILFLLAIITVCWVMISVRACVLVGLKNQTNGLDMNQIYAKNRKEWQQWLSVNHDKEAGVWLVYYKKGRGKPSIDYEASVEEALCFGWIDGIIKKLDDERYMRKFRQRRDGSNWSGTNEKRVEKLLAQGLMTTAGSKWRSALKPMKKEWRNRSDYWNKEKNLG